MNPTQRLLSSKELAEKHFHLKEGKKYVCLLCNPNWTAESTEEVKTYTKGKGYQWAVQHLNGKHEGFQTHVASAQTLLISPDATNTYQWLEWIVAENRELDFVNKARVRKFTKGNLKPINHETLKKRMHATVEVTEEFLKKKLPKKFGIAFDGWSQDGVHYLAVFAVGDGLPQECDGCVLLGFSPFEQEDDLSSDQHVLYLTQLLSYYDRSMGDVLYLVGDNCATNRKVSNDTIVPLIGCNSHKLNLAVSRYLGLSVKSDEAANVQCTAEQLHRRGLVQKLTTLMSKLKTIKGKGKLREFTDYVAIKANETRWNGNYRMCVRYNLFKEALEKLANEDTNIGREVASLLPTHAENGRIRLLAKELTKFHSISLLLQKKDGTISLADVRDLFDGLIQDFGHEFRHYLAPDSEIVNNPDFENGIVKVLKGSAISTMEKIALCDLETHSTVAGDDEEQNDSDMDYGIQLLQSSRKKRRISVGYSVSRIPVTSNVVERFFSQVKLNVTNMRNSLLPSTLEAIMFIKMNAALITAATVQKALVFLANKQQN